MRFLGSRPEVRARSTGITGFCMGGQYALMAACTVPSIAACVQCPYLRLFGEDDALIPRADVKELEGILRRTGKIFQTKIYPGAGHVFFNDTRPDAYRPDAAKDAWTRALASSARIWTPSRWRGDLPHLFQPRDQRRWSRLPKPRRPASVASRPQPSMAGAGVRATASAGVQASSAMPVPAGRHSAGPPWVLQTRPAWQAASPGCPQESPFVPAPAETQM